MNSVASGAKRSATALVFMALALLPGCYREVGEDLYPGDCDSSDVTYSLTILPILRDNCYECHGSPAPISLLPYEDFAVLKSKVDDGKLVCAINHDPGCFPMPKDRPKLPDCEIRLIEIWIENGALNN